MSRSAGITASYTAQTIMADGLVAFEHELGDFYGNAALPWAETFDLNLTSGAQLITVKQMIPDVDGDASGLLYSLFYRNSRSTGAPEQRTTPRPVRSDGYVDFRQTGRDIRLRLEVGAAQPGSELHAWPAPGGRGCRGVTADGSSASDFPQCFQPPPDLPHMPDVGPAAIGLSALLRIVGENSTATKLDTRTAQPGIFAARQRRASAGTTPAVFHIQVQTDGTLVAVPVAIGE